MGESEKPADKPSEQPSPAGGIPAPRLPPPVSPKNPQASPEPSKKKPDLGSYLGIVSIVAGVLVAMLQANGVEMNWIVSAAIYCAILAVGVWTFLVHAAPHRTPVFRCIVVFLQVILIGMLGCYGTYKQYRREHPILANSTTELRLPILRISSGPILYPGSDDTSLSTEKIEHRRRHVLTVENPNVFPLLPFGIVIQLPEPILYIKPLLPANIMAYADWLPQELTFSGHSSNSYTLEPFGTNQPIVRWKVGFLDGIPKNSSVGLEIVTVNGSEGGASGGDGTNSDDFVRWFLMPELRANSTDPSNHIMFVQPLAFDSTTRSLTVEPPLETARFSSLVEYQFGKGFRIPGLVATSSYYTMWGQKYGPVTYVRLEVESPECKWAGVALVGNPPEPAFMVYLKDGSAIQIGANGSNLKDMKLK